VPLPSARRAMPAPGGLSGVRPLSVGWLSRPRLLLSDGWVGRLVLVLVWTVVSLRRQPSPLADNSI
jgi:hypothetical protein